MISLQEKGALLKESERKLAVASTHEKNLALREVAHSIDQSREKILEANALDVENARNGRYSIT